MPPSSRPVSSRSRSSSSGAGGHVPDRVAQVVEQRDVLDREVGGRHDFDSSRAAPPGRARPRPRRDRNSGSRSREDVGRRERRPPGGSEVEERLVRQHLVVEGLTSPLATALTADLAPHGVEQRVRDAQRSCLFHDGLGHQVPAQVSTSCRSSTIVSSRQKMRNSRAARQGPAGGPCAASAQPSGPGRHVGDSRLVVPGRADALDDLAQRPQRDLGLAELSSTRSM